MQPSTRQCILATLGICLAGTGLIFAAVWNYVFGLLLAKELVLTPSSKTFELWKAPPIPLTFDVYLYNWTNPRNFTKDDYEKPIVEQIGPYRFKEVPDKTNIRWHPRNSTISYRRRSTYYFDEENSVGKLDDRITTVNVVSLSAASKSRHWGYVKQKEVSLGLNWLSQKVYITKEARELLFEGYQDDMIDIAQQFARTGDPRFNVPYDRFGWFYKRNHSDQISGHFNIHTGIGDMSQFGQMQHWNYEPATSYFPDECGEVIGSGGEFYIPNQKKDKPVTLFNGEICRYLNLYFTSEENVRGVKGYKYSGTERTVDNGTKYPENECFSSGEKVPSGVMNITTCRYGAPVMVSFPHFYSADPYFGSLIDGLKPSKEKHEFYITLEPTSGIPIDVAVRLQANVMIRPVSNVAMYEEAPVLFFPVIWFEQRVRFPEQMLEDVKTVSLVPTIGYICAAVLVAIGAIILAYLMYDKFVVGKRLRKENEKGGNIRKNMIEVNRFSGKASEESPLVFKNSDDYKPVHSISELDVKSESTQLPIAPLATIEADDLDLDLDNNDNTLIEKEFIMTPQ